jgi:lipid-binding SYLF domain-containing protein
MRKIGQRRNRQRGAKMSNLRTIIVALAAALAGLTSARADSGTVRISFIKAGWVIGGSVGSGTLTFRGRSYPLTVGGLSYGFTFGGSQTNLVGRVSNIFRPSDIEGVYGAAGAGATLIRGAQAIILTNQKGAVLEVSGRQTGLMVNLDLSGMALSLR